MTVRCAHPMPFGAQLIAPDRTRFRLWAPSAQAVALEVDGIGTMPMMPAAGCGQGWLEAEAACGAGARYRYRVKCDGNASGDANDIAVPDPASRAQDGDVHDASVVVDPQAFAWRTTGWRGRPWHETVLYELHVGACGGFDGVIEKLPRLAALGITAIELMPVADFPGRHNWGYDGVLLFAPDAAYGTPEQLKTLIDTAHELGMMVFLDVVYNHFGPDGNYLGSYAAPFFRNDISTLWGQAIDFRHREVRDFFIENALYWLTEYRFDGLRLDAVHAISGQGWLEELAERVRDATEPGRHMHLVLENDDNAARLLDGPGKKLFDAQWNDDWHHALHVLLTGEHDGYYLDYADAPAAQLARALAEGFVYQGEASPHRHGEARGEPSAHLPPTRFVAFLHNHDQIGNRAFGERLTQLADPHALRAATALLLLAPHIPLLFMGDEFGSTQPFLYFTDHAHSSLANAVREGRRQEFEKFPAFANAKQRASIPDPNDEDTFQASIPQWPDAQPTGDECAGEGDTADADPTSPDSWLRWTRKLLAIRHAHIVPRIPGATAIGAAAIGPKAVAARWRLGDGVIFALALNLSESAVAVDLDQLSHPAGADLLLETDGALAALSDGTLLPHAFIAWLEPAP